MYTRKLQVTPFSKYLDGIGVGGLGLQKYEKKFCTNEVFPVELLTTTEKFDQGRPQFPLDPDASITNESQEPMDVGADIATFGDTGFVGLWTTTATEETDFHDKQLAAVDVQIAFRDGYDFRRILSPILMLPTAEMYGVT